VQATLWQIAQKYTPKNEAANYTQAIMDLGATCCTRTQPFCERCPLQKKCEAYLYQEQHLFPHKKPTKKNPTKHLYMICLFNNKNEILLEQRPLKGIWGGLYSLPEFLTQKTLQAFLTKYFTQESDLEPLAPIKHTFTHFHLNITPFKAKVKSQRKTHRFENKCWQKIANLSTIGLPAPIQKILAKEFLT
jgi:A/G-specific adenine glycosylase